MWMRIHWGRGATEKITPLLKIRAFRTKELLVFLLFFIFEARKRQLAASNAPTANNLVKEF
jgi:hypothetical protein